MQTIYTTLWYQWHKQPAIAVKRERLVTPDHDFIDIDWCGEIPDEKCDMAEKRADKTPRPLVILLHGLAGSAQSGYIQGMQKILLQNEIRSVALNFRGCSGQLNRLARGYHSGDTGDIHYLYQVIREREPDTQLAAVGFSLGGNVLLKWLGEQGEGLDLKTAVAVSVPLVLANCADKLDRGLSRFYRRYLLQELLCYMQAKREHLYRIGAEQEAKKIDALGDFNRIKSQISSFWQYDDRIVAPLHGFKDVHDYYQRSSSRQFLRQIAVPTLLIQAMDDPFMTPAVLPEKSELSSAIQLQITPSGGHVGFISGGFPFRSEFWLQPRILQQLRISFDLLSIK